MIFENRQEAGKKLALELLRYREENPIILALPRGGVPIGYEVAKVLHAPLDVLVVRKIGLSGNKEFGVGAIAEGGVKVFDQTSIESLGINTDIVSDTVELEEKELERRVEKYRGGRNLPSMQGKTVILVDDGMATGVTARVAIESVKKLHPQKLIIAAPVCAFEVAENLRLLVNNAVFLFTPYEFSAVGVWYKNFEQVSDEEVVNLLSQTSI